MEESPGLMTKTKVELALERGRRLRVLREQTGLSRSAFAEQLNISEHTLKAFENGVREISAQTAREYSRMLLLFGVDVSFEFLYYGTETEGLEHREVVINDERHIYNEAISFKQNNPSSIIFTIQDSLMSPFFNKGDIVGGQKITIPDQFPLLNGYICIVEATDGVQSLRKIIKSEGRKIICCSLSTDISNNQPLVEEIEAFSIAQVTRHWHLSTLVPNLHVGQLTEKVPNFSPNNKRTKKNLKK